MLSVNQKRFAKVYNDLKKYPSIADVAVALGLSHQTIRNRAALYRAKADPDLPALASRLKVAAVTIDPEHSAEDHAKARAINLAAEVQALVTSSNYPLINPEAIIVESHMVRRYDRNSLDYEMKEGKPRTWLKDILQVAPVEDCRGKTFIFTSAQNDTEIHQQFWINLQVYAIAKKAKIVVGPGTYETQWWSENNPTSRAYDQALTKFLCFGQMKIGKDFVFCGETNILPTAASPINDMQTYSRGRWAVFPHAKRQLKSVASTDPSVQAHQVMTTGSVTTPKVIPRKAGVKSIFHHVLGAVLVEFDQDGDVFTRHLSADKDGSFYDLDSYVNDGKVTSGHRVRSIVGADIHRRKMGPKNALAFFGLDIATGETVNDINLLDVLQPEHYCAHDIFDNETRNHHNEKDNALRYQLAYRGRDRVIDEVSQIPEFLRQIYRPWCQIEVIESNHDIALTRWVNEGRYRLDGANIKLGLELDLALQGYQERIGDALDAYKPVPNFSLLEYAVRKYRGAGNLDHATWRYDGKSFLIDGVECGHHGFRGANGAKGTVSGYARMGRKMSIGDKHSPEINEGVYVAGVMELQQGYNKGPSGWAVTVIVQYKNGKRALLTLQNGKLPPSFYSQR